MKRIVRAIAPALVLALGLVACGDDSDPSASDVTEAVTDVSEAVDDVTDEAGLTSADLAETLRENGLDSIATAVEAIDVEQVLPDGEFTFLAPNDDAFLGLGADELADLLADPGRILDVLQNHAIAERLTATEVVEAGTVETENGSTLEVTEDGETVMIGDATVVQADIEVGDGVVHVVDVLLLP